MKHIQPPPTPSPFESMTDSDMIAKIDELRVKLDNFRVANELQKLVHALTRKYTPKERYPYGLLLEGATEANFTIQPYTTQEIDHLVLSPETAKHWRLVDLKVSNIGCSNVGDVEVGQGNIVERKFDIPLDVFSVEHVKNETLSNVLRFKVPTVTPANRIHLTFVSHEMRDFSGILWVSSGII
jgi:hypothetical protein